MPNVENELRTLFHKIAGAENIPPVKMADEFEAIWEGYTAADALSTPRSVKSDGSTVRTGTVWRRGGKTVSIVAVGVATLLVAVGIYAALEAHSTTAAKGSWLQPGGNNSLVTRLMGVNAVGYDSQGVLQVWGMTGTNAFHAKDEVLQYKNGRWSKEDLGKAFSNLSGLPSDAWSAIAFSPQGRPEMVGTSSSAGAGTKPLIYDYENGMWVRQEFRLPFSGNGGFSLFWSPSGKPVVVPGSGNSTSASTPVWEKKTRGWLKIQPPKLAPWAMVDPTAPTILAGLAAGPHGQVTARYQNVSTSPYALTNQFWQYRRGKWTHLKNLDRLVSWNSQGCQLLYAPDGALTLVELDAKGHLHIWMDSNGKVTSVKAPFSNRYWPSIPLPLAAYSHDGALSIAGEYSKSALSSTQTVGVWQLTRQ